MIRKTKLLVVTMLMALFSVGVSAQVTTASMSGKIVGSNNEPLIGATVKATHTPTGTVYAVSTHADGTYHLSNLRIGGPYLVEVTYVGYQKKSINDIQLTLGEERNLNVSLEESTQMLGEVTVVSDRSGVISSSRTGAQEIVTREKMDKLPTINRSLDDFTRLTPMSSGKNFGGTSYRFNNVTVDGASFNNSFGLSSALGASGIEPISLEALEQVQVMIAPYDVRNGGFTGAGINSVTKSGTNNFHVSAYTYIKSPSLIGYRVKDQNLSVTNFANHQYGFSVSGPIIKNKLFFFLNGEMDRQEMPITYTTANSAAKASVLQDLSNFLVDQFGYNPGSYDVTKTNTQADRITARLDWNINRKNILSLKYFYLKSFNTNNPSTSGAPKNGRGPNQYAIPFSSTYYRLNNNFNIVMADLNTIINDNMSNYLKFGYSALRDFRDMDGGFFPQVDILNGDNTSNIMAMTTFGTEANSYNNKLNTDIWQIQDNFLWNLGKHLLTIGTQSDYRKFENGFAQNYPGAWVFSSVDDFKFNVLATKDYLKNHNNNISGFDITTYNPATFGLNPIKGGLTNSSGTGYSYYSQKYAIGDKFPYAYVNVAQISLYAQDKWSILDNLNVTLGLRADVPIFLTDLPTNDNVAKETYRDGIKVDVSKYPNTKILLSPRLGVNYNLPLGEGGSSLQLRGGTGIFAGTPPYVWLSNQAGNNGVLFGDINVSGSALKTLGFTGDMNTYKPAAGSATRADIAVTDPNFKYPTLWKSDIAADFKFAGGWIATVEVLQSKDLNAIYHDNIGIVRTSNFVNDGSGQQARPFYNGYYSDQTGNNKAAYNVILLRNTDKGHSLFTTVKLQKSFERGALKGLYVDGSYTFGNAKSVTDGTSSVATSAWKYRPALDANAQELGYSAGSFDGRILITASYSIDWSKNNSTTFGLVYQRFRPFRYSYTYNGDANGDTQSANDLIYIPNSLSEISANLDKGSFTDQNAAWTALDAFISQDPYLSKHRGQFAERNGAVAPFANQLDFSVNQDFKVWANKTPHTLRFSFNIFNFLNLMNKNWGVQETTVLGNQQYQFLNVTQKPTSANNYTLKYSMNNTLIKTFQDYIGNDSRWQMQFGVKYFF